MTAQEPESQAAPQRWTTPTDLADVERHWFRRELAGDVMREEDLMGAGAQCRTDAA